MRKIDTIVIHCAATPQNLDIGVDEIRKWHTDPKPKGRGWSDVAYHYIIRRNGITEEGRPVRRQGAHVRGHNKTSIGICLIGGTDADNRTKAEVNYTTGQWAELGDWVQQLIWQYGIKKNKVVGHCDLDNRKTCPNFDVRAWASMLDFDNPPPTD
jgi:N-acetyl-anhydromuramyl-L-alanine amidase AmpD